MFGIGSTELALILLFAFLILGPDKLPQFAKTVGRAIAKFRDVQEEVNEVVRKEVYDPAKDKEPLSKAAAKAESVKSPAATESFAERKARYDRERDARIQAERQQHAQAGTAGASGPGGAPKPAVSAEELYGVSAKPAPKASASEPAAKPAPASSPVAKPAPAASVNAEGGDR